MAKKTVTFTIEEERWEQLKEILPCSRSEFLGDCILRAIESADDEETKLLKKITEHKNELDVLESKLCKIRKNKLKKVEEEKDLTPVKEVLERVANTTGVMGKTMLNNLAKSTSNKFQIVVDLATDMGIDVKENYEPPREGKQRGGLLR